MKVLQINTTFRNGGSTGRITYDLMRIQEKNGINGFVAYGHRTGEQKVQGTLCLQNEWRRKINILRSRLFDHHGFYNENETKRLIKWLDEIRPDIIHLHNLHNHYIHVGKLFDYIKASTIPVVWTLHDCWSFTGHCSYFDFAGCNRWKIGCGGCPCIHDYPPTWFFDRTSRNYENKKETFCGVENLTLVSPSHWLAALTRESFLNDYPIAVINNGVDTDVFKPQDIEKLKTSLNINGRKVLLAMAGGFGVRKGGAYLKTIPELLNEDELLLLVGRGASTFSKVFPKKCIGIEYTNDIHELAGYYSLADVFINPTLEDNFPTTNIEAMSCGTPVITFNTGGSIESVLDGEKISNIGEVKITSVGAVVPKGDMQSMLDVARTIMASDNDEYKTHCRAKAFERYNKDKQFMKYIDLYKKIRYGIS